MARQTTVAIDGHDITINGIEPDAAFVLFPRVVSFVALAVSKMEGADLKLADLDPKDPEFKAKLLGRALGVLDMSRIAKAALAVCDRLPVEEVQFWRNALLSTATIDGGASFATKFKDGAISLWTAWQALFHAVWFNFVPSFGGGVASVAPPPVVPSGT